MTDLEQLSRLVKLTGDRAQPNLNPLAMKIRDIDALALSVKYFGYELARTLAGALPSRTALAPVYQGLASKPSTQADLESDWVATWCGKLGIPVVFHRKIWELCYVLQALHDADLLVDSARGLGFGCGQEPIPSFLASNGVSVVVTDLNPEASAAQGWLSSAQHTTSLARVHKQHLVDEETFRKYCTLRYVDMNDLPDDLRGFDFCWSICALEHLGSIAAGLDFIENSLKTLRPGGLAVHTTEFNFLNDDETIDNWPTVLFQKKHFVEIERRLTAAGHMVRPLDFDVGSKPLDRFVDIPPWPHDQSDYVRSVWGSDTAHIKLSIDGFVSTCFGIIVQKAH
ncbi:MAG: methyltransferase domain-containing protein [Beijerinckiaceae bacterium]